MLVVEHDGLRLCDGVNRREWLRVGGLAAGGLSLPALLNAQSRAAENGVIKATAKACIQIFLWGGPGAQETWDIKPDAPDGTRGEFRAIGTSVPGFGICEHLPRLAQRADRYAIVRSLTHEGVNHGTSAYHMLTGHVHWSPGTLRHPTPADMPNLGANAARFLHSPADLPAHVHLPAIVNDGDGLPVPGQDPGILGEKFAPFRVLGDPTQRGFKVPALALAEGVSYDRLARRVQLRAAIDQQAAHLGTSTIGGATGTAAERALSLLSSERTERAFNLSHEPESLRDEYGWHHFGQSLLLARRIVEAGVPFVTVYWNAPTNTDNQSWDTHANQHVRMRDHLLPAFDRGLSALLDDLRSRGLLDSTLVTWYGEFGRTPKINRNVGRDHWGFCQSIGLAGGGVQSGLVHGSSNKDGGYPETSPVRPDDLAATIFHCLGIDHMQHMHDLQQRPLPLSYGRVVQELLM